MEGKKGRKKEKREEEGQEGGQYKKEYVHEEQTKTPLF